MKLPCFARFWPNCVALGLSVGRSLRLPPLHTPLPTPIMLHWLVRNMGKGTSVCVRTWRRHCLREPLAEPGDVQQFLQRPRRPAAPEPGPLFDSEANRTGVRQTEFLDSTELKQMLCGPKCFVRSTTESVRCQSLSNQKGTGRNINIAIVSVQADFSVLFSGNSK